MIVDQVLLDAAQLNASAGTYDMMGNGQCVTFYVQGTGTIGAGALELETAGTPDYAGTWVSLTTGYALTNVSGGKQVMFQYTGPFRAVRARISTTVSTTGSVTVRVVAQ